jgi:hypothetical protein
MITSDQLDELANKYNKNKDKYVYDLWFKKVKEWADGPHNIERRSLSSGRGNKTDDGTYKVIK